MDELGGKLTIFGNTHMLQAQKWHAWQSPLATHGHHPSFGTLGPTRPIAALQAVRRNMSGWSKGGQTPTFSKALPICQVWKKQKKPGTLNNPFLMDVWWKHAYFYMVKIWNHHLNWNNNFNSWGPFFRDFIKARRLFSFRPWNVLMKSIPPETKANLDFYGIIDIVKQTI